MIRGGDSMTKRALAVGALVLSTALVVGGFAAAQPQATADTVTAGKPSELRFTLSKRSVAKGKVSFTVTNRGKLKHDFKIAGKKTPVLAPGKRATLSVTFSKAGRFPYLCTVPGHAAGGMKGTLVVR
jgi:uncharacterized cupredoxin-like copper-binding protein